MQFSEEFVKSALPEAEYFSTTHQQQYNFSIDSRTLTRGDFFIALRGEKSDGHQFIHDAINAGAAGIMIERASKDLLSAIDSRTRVALCIIIVADTHKALCVLAKAWRALFSGTVVGITGSVGKTTTKEYLAKILSDYNVEHIASYDNQNSKYGVALNLLRLRDHHKIGVFELGISKRGEMSFLADMVRPTVACITNVGHAHMEGLGSIVDIATEKRDIFKYFCSDNIGIINGDIALLSHVAYHHPVIKFGSKTTNQVQARKVAIQNKQAKFTLKIYRHKYAVTLKKGHMGDVFNCLAAAGIAYQLNVPDNIVVQSLQEMMPIPGRFKEHLSQSGQCVVIDDCYNANPESMKAALTAFEFIETDAEKIAVLGDMHELGVNSPFWHRQLGRFLRKVPSLRNIILVGNLINWTKKTVPINVQVTVVPSWKEAADLLAQRTHKTHEKKSLILVKGSGVMKLKNLVNSLCS